jgi:hypothetical protein
VINSWRNILTSTVVRADIGVAHETKQRDYELNKCIKRKQVYMYLAQDILRH